MKKMDEMDKNILLRAQALGYKCTLILLSLWTFYNCYQVLAHGAKYSPLPGLVVCFAVCIQGFAQMAMKRKMIAGDEEYREPNKILWAIVAGVGPGATFFTLGPVFFI